MTRSADAYRARNSSINALEFEKSGPVRVGNFM